MRILYYQVPVSVLGSVSNIAAELTTHIAKKIELIPYPSFRPERRYFRGLLTSLKYFLVLGLDIMHFNIVPPWINGSWGFFELARSRNVKTLLNLHGVIPIENLLGADKYNPSKYVAYRTALLKTQIACRRVDKIIVHSRFMLNSMAEVYGISPDRITVIPNGLELERFSPKPKQFSLLGEPSLLYVGSLIKLKGVDVLIRAVAKLRKMLPHVRLHLVGSGPWYQYLRLLSVREGIEKQTMFWGQIDKFHIPLYYRAADICIFPSRFEAFGLAVLEALASGKPTIASNVGGIPEILSDGKNGILVEPNNTEALAKAILRVFHDANLMKSLSENVLKTAALYSWKNIAERYLLTYESMMN